MCPWSAGDDQFGAAQGLVMLIGTDVQGTASGAVRRDVCEHSSRGLTRFSSPFRSSQRWGELPSGLFSYLLRKGASKALYLLIPLHTESFPTM